VNAMNVIDAMIDLGMEAWLDKPYRWKDVGDYLGKTANAARKEYRRFTQRADREGVPVQSFVTQENNYLEDVMTPQRFLDRIEGSETLELKGGRVSYWTQNGKENFSVRAQVQPKTLSIADFTEAIIEGVNSASIPVPERHETEAPLMGVVSLYDLHIERTPVSIEYILGALENYLHPYKDDIVEIVFPVGNDLGNTDNVQGTTTKGTPQENLMSIKEGIWARVNLITSVIDYLAANFEKVVVPMVPGNHDEYGTYWLGTALEQRYRDNASVVIMPADYRQYYRWGGNAFMFYHGEMRFDPALVFVSEAPEVFAGAKHIEIHTGHFHKTGASYQLINESYGIIKRTMPSLAKGDTWHRQMGFVGNNRGFQVNLYKFEGGVKCMTTL